MNRAAPAGRASLMVTLTRGVHGPQDVHAIFVEAPVRG